MRRPKHRVGVVGESNETACIFAENDLTAKLSPSVLLDEAGTQALLAELPQRDVSKDVSLISWLWELVLSNEQMIVADWERSHCNEIQGMVTVGTYLLGRDSIHIGPQSKIKPCVVIDADNGPVCIGKNVTILPHSYVQGPAYIADDCLLQPGTTIHAGTTIGPCSKVGGEIETSIIQGYSNKQHDGFLGHSYIGSWVNIGADCLNSDLKNTYGTVRVPINGREVDTGELFVGMTVGDHSKLGINVSFPTGAVVGFCSSVVTPRSPKFVPSFTWLNGDVAQRYDGQRGLQVARKVMARRNKSMSLAEERLFRAVGNVARKVEHYPEYLLEKV